MSKKPINELNVVSRFIGDFFDGISSGTADRIISNAKQRGLPKELTDRMEKIQKEKELLVKGMKKYL